MLENLSSERQGWGSLVGRGAYDKEGTYGDFWVLAMLFLDPNGVYMVVEKLVCFIIICKTIHLCFMHSSVCYSSLKKKKKAS